MPIRFDDGNQGQSEFNKGGVAPLLAVLATLVIFWKYPRLTVFLLLLAATIYLSANPEASERLLGFELGTKIQSFFN